MRSELAKEIFALIEGRSPVPPTPIEFELAYQARVATDRMRYAIKCIEQFGPRSDEMREACFQLLDGLDRLESAERNFQKRFRISTPRSACEPKAPSFNGEGNDRKAFHDQ
jgi:hypothetical protein